MAATADPSRLKARLWKLNNFRVFAAGMAHGKPWTEDDIDDMVRNARDFGHLVRPTLVIGHEEAQPLVEGLPATAEQNTGAPAFGRLINFRKDHWQDEKGNPVVGLACDAVDMPGWLAVKLAGKSFIDRSAEIYDKPPDGLEKAKGPILRRVSLLGGELPQVKNLGPMPDPELQLMSESPVLTAASRPLKLVSVAARGPCTVFRFSECSPMPCKTAVTGKKYKCFSELPPITKCRVHAFAEATRAGNDKGTLAGISRDDMLGMLADYGVSPEKLVALDDNALAEMLRLFSSQAPPEMTGEAQDDGPVSLGIDALLSRSTLLDQLFAFGVDPALADSLSTPAAEAMVGLLTANGCKTMDNDSLAQRFAERANRNPSARRFGGLTKDTIMKTYAAETAIRPGLTLSQHLRAQ